MRDENLLAALEAQTLQNLGHDIPSGSTELYAEGTANGDVTATPLPLPNGSDAPTTQTAPTTPPVPVSQNASFPGPVSTAYQSFADPTIDRGAVMKVRDKAMATAPNYRMADSCSTCTASAYDSSLGEACCKLYNIPILTNYVCDNYSGYTAPAKFSEKLAEQELSEPAAEPTPAEVPVTDAVEALQVTPADLELFAQAQELANSYKGKRSKKVYAIAAYKKAYKEKHSTLTGAFKLNRPMTDLEKEELQAKARALYAELVQQ